MTHVESSYRSKKILTQEEILAELYTDNVSDIPDNIFSDTDRDDLVSVKKSVPIAK